LTPDLRDPIEARLKKWRDEVIAYRLPALVRMNVLGQDPAIAGEVRAYFAQLAQGGGVRTRAEMAATLDQISPEDRRRIATTGIITGSLDIFHPLLLKPEPTRLRLALLAVRDRTPMPPVPMAGLGLLDRPEPDLVKAATQAGYHSFGDQMLRVDLVERIAKSLHDQRQGFKPFTPDRKLSVSLGIGEATLNRVMRALGFVPLATPETWKWRGLRRPTALPAPTRTGAFAALQSMTAEKKR
jgi:ATP-dependent RNA helicase SUPV3L1/SUV3